MNAATETHAPSSKKRITIERTYKAAVEELWDLWTTKDGFESWWGPEGFRVEVRALEAHKGGLLHYDMIADAPEQIAAMEKMGQPLSHETRGTFTDVRRLARLAITHVIDFLPGVEAYDSTVDVEFSSTAGSSRMVITLDAMHSEQFTQMAVMGWHSQLTKLDKKYGVTPAEPLPCPVPGSA